MKKIWNLPVVENLPFAEIAEPRRVLLVSSPPAWQAVHPYLRRFNVAEMVEPRAAELAHWESLLSALPRIDLEVVYAVGGGLAADAAKYIAARTRLPLVMLPTALSVDAFLTSASGIRRDGCVFYIETKVPERLILDLEVIASAPLAVRAAGITDVLSIATGCWDWRFAHERGQNPPGMEFIPWAHEAAQAILRGALDCAEAAGRGDPQGLKTLFDCLALEVQLCNQLGHARPEEGSEHYFAYLAENFTGPGLPHGDLVGPGILHMARRQGQDTRPMERALHACSVPLDRVSPVQAAQIDRQLPEYCARHALAYGIAHTLEDL